MFVVAVLDGVVTVVMVVADVVACTDIVVVVVVFGVAVLVATTEDVEVDTAMVKQSQALDKVAPDGYGLSADGSGVVAAAALFVLNPASHVLEVTVVTSPATVTVEVEVLNHELDSDLCLCLSESIRLPCIPCTDRAVYLLAPFLNALDDCTYEIEVIVLVRRRITVWVEIVLVVTLGEM